MQAGKRVILSWQAASVHFSLSWLISALKEGEDEPPTSCAKLPELSSKLHSRILILFIPFMRQNYNLTFLFESCILKFRSFIVKNIIKNTISSEESKPSHQYSEDCLFFKSRENKYVLRGLQVFGLSNVRTNVKYRCVKLCTGLSDELKC